MSLQSERPGHKACSVIYVELCADRTYRSVSLVRGTASRRGKAKITRFELHLAASLGHCPSRTVQVEINRGAFSTGASFEWYARSNGGIPVEGLQPRSNQLPAPGAWRWVESYYS